jgi:hypothetical protein
LSLGVPRVKHQTLHTCLSACLLFVFASGGTGFELRAAYKAGVLLLEPHLKVILEMESHKLLVWASFKL